MLEGRDQGTNNLFRCFLIPIMEEYDDGYFHQRH
jgi:hypothetical protein